VFAHGHQGPQAFGKDGFVAKSVHGRKLASAQLNRKHKIGFLSIKLVYLLNFRFSWCLLHCPIGVLLVVYDDLLIKIALNYKFANQRPQQTFGAAAPHGQGRSGSAHG
jgi:hypothetical protein